MTLMTYTVETVRTVAGKRYYIRCQGKLMRGGFASRAAVWERIKFLEVMDQARENLKAQIQHFREERRA